MKIAIWAEYFHLSTSNEDSSHGLCSAAWYKYIKIPQNNNKNDKKKHFHLVPAIINFIKYILKSEIHGDTHDSKESLNNVVIILRIPKTAIVSHIIWGIQSGGQI